MHIQQNYFIKYRKQFRAFFAQICCFISRIFEFIFVPLEFESSLPRFFFLSMGSAFSMHPQEPMWFSYYGPIRHAEASEALDAAITSHLQEIGSSSAIPIRKETADQVMVPVALNSPPFSENNGSYILHYATSMPGRLTFSIGSKPSTDLTHETVNTNKSPTENQADVPQSPTDDTNDIIDIIEFDVGLDLTYLFPSILEGTFSFQFDFEVMKGVSSRIFVVKITRDQIPVVTDDKVVVDGVTSLVSRVFHEDATQDGESDFSDGLCLICCTNPATVITFPCRHCCMCRSCSEKFAKISNHCPVCRSIVHELIDCSTPDLREKAV